jgi:hypothetical protein
MYLQPSAFDEHFTAAAKGFSLSTHAPITKLTDWAFNRLYPARDGQAKWIELNNHATIETDSKVGVVR